MPADNYRLIYHSQNRLSGAPETMLASVEQILATSRRNNDRVGVTGALMFNTEYFAQVLEGDAGAIEATFERIQQDSRHAAVTLLEFVPAPTRVFGNWSMAFVGAPTADQLRYSDIGMRSGFDPSRLTSHDLLLRLRDLLADDSSAAA